MIKFTSLKILTGKMHPLVNLNLLFSSIYCVEVTKSTVYATEPVGRSNCLSVHF